SAAGADPISSTTVSGGTASFTIAKEGTTTISFHAVDNAGNVEADRTFTVQIDKTAPVVTYSGNAGTYSVDQTVSITCSATEYLSGVASSPCKDITGPAYAFNLGLNRFSATATDNAGNTGSGSTSFTVQVTPSGLSGLVSQWVTDPAVAQGLRDKLTVIAQGNAGPKAGAGPAVVHPG